jgi:serine/threonine protein phosphatase PrpC
VADFGNGIYVFGIFDGGGGPWIARYCKDNFASTLKNQASFKHGDYTSALKDAFLAIDKSLLGDAFKTTFLSSKFDEKTRDATLTHSYMNTSSTALVCLIVETTIYIANAGSYEWLCALICLITIYIGDSKAIVFYKESTTKPHKTTEHTLLNRAEDARVIRLGGSTITYAGYRYVWSGCAMLMSTRCIGQETLSCDLFSLPKGMHAFKSNTTKPASDQIVIASPDVYTYELSGLSLRCLL